MIVVTGTEGTSEFEVALTIKIALAALWPGCETSPPDDELIRIAASAKISGYKVSDLDILIAAKLRPGRAFVPRRVVRDRNGARVTGPVHVRNFVATIEVKDHDPARVRVTGEGVQVQYTSAGPAKWSDAVQQNVEQAHAIKAYFDHQHQAVYVYRALIMRGFDKAPCSGALGASFDGSAFLTALAETSPVSSHGKEFALRSAQADAIEKVLAAPVFRTVAPSSLDRRRMDRIVTQNPEVESYLRIMGTKMLRLRGRGGTGKTVMLLQLAWRAFDELAARSLVLTYNHTLSSDISRLMALMKVPSDPAEGGVAVRTVMSFMTAWLTRLGLPPESGEWLDGQYEKQCSAALEMLREGALTPDDIEAVKLADPMGFAFDFVIADEAQDWPSSELELLKALYAPERLCLADGVDQLVRGGAATWELGVPDSRRVVVPLKRCLRMKANLAIFANAVAERVGLNWSVEPNPEARGGRIIVCDGPLETQQELVSELLLDAELKGNSSVDSLICVPPSDVKGEAPNRASQCAQTLRESGYEVWDATNEAERRDFPRSPAALRVVQYASCRGLEGWCVFLQGFDEAWTHARSEALRTGFEQGGMSPDERAWRQCLIPLTRGIDTVVIGFTDGSSHVRSTLLAIARLQPDLIEVRRSAEQ